MPPFHKTIVVSGVNIHAGGALEIFRTVLSKIVRFYPEAKVYAFVHDKRLFKEISGVIYRQFPKWSTRAIGCLFYDYIYFWFVSKKLKPDLWFSLNDRTPVVEAKKRVLYCHNLSFFYKGALTYFILQPSFAFQLVLQRISYHFNFSKNDVVVVQQQHVRDLFFKRFKSKAIVVSNPEFFHESVSLSPETTKTGKVIFFYPALPRFFKNFEVIIKAVKHLEKKYVDCPFEVWITLDGTENFYSKYIHYLGKDCCSIRWLGHLPKARIDELYNSVHFLLFPSVLESWGLPISEAKNLGIPILVSDLPYAKETVGTYAKTFFLNPHQPEVWAKAMESCIKGTPAFSTPLAPFVPNEPFCPSWQDLLKFLLQEKYD